MKTAIKKLLGLANERPVEIRVTEKCHAVIDGEHRSLSVGEVLEVSPRTAAELIGVGRAVDIAAEAREQEAALAKAALIPPPYERRPVPEGWDKLPECFAKWWELNESGRAPIYRRDAIEQAICGEPVSALTDDGNLNRVPYGQRRRLLQAQQLRFLSETDLENQRYLRDVLERAKRAVDDWNAANLDDLFTLQIACSDALIEAHGELDKTARAIAKAGFELFATRVAALGLGNAKTHELYRGSADYERFENAAPSPTLQDLRLLWNIDNGHDLRNYVDQPVPVLAEMLASRMALQAHYSDLERSAKAELATARKAVA